MITFRSLGVRTILKCLIEVCPQIYQDDMVVSINHSLSFLEFYEVLLLCAHEMVEKNKKEKQAALEELAKVEEQSEKAESEHNITTFASEKKISKRNSKEKRKIKLK